MPEAWVEAVDEHRKALEVIADSDGPLSDDCQRLLDDYERVTD